MVHKNIAKVNGDPHKNPDADKFETYVEENITFHIQLLYSNFRIILFISKFNISDFYSFIQDSTTLNTDCVENRRFSN